MAKSSALLRHEKSFWQPASALRDVEEHISLEVPALRLLFSNGLPRGSIAELNGPRSSGRASVCLYILAQATANGEVCAVIDTNESFCPFSAFAAGVKLDRVIWVRCQGNTEYALRITDLLLHAGGFGVVALDLCEVKPSVLSRIPLSYWYRFRRAVENTPAILLICADTAQAKSCNSSHLELKQAVTEWSGTDPYLLLKQVGVKAAASKISVPRMHFLQIQGAG